MMKKYTAIKHKPFSDQEISEMKQLMQSKTTLAMQRKYQAIYLHMNGKSNKEIAVILGRDQGVIGKYINTYYEKGINGLIPIKQAGRPSRMTKEQKEQLRQTINEQTPHHVGFPHAYNWTVELAIQWVEKTFHLKYSNGGMLKILHKLGLSWTRPTYTLAKADKEKQKQFSEQLDDLKKTDFQ